jgi:three-Cys-motif partner protein
VRNDAFYDKPTEQSQVKARIVGKYFWAWAKVVIPWAKRRKIEIGYVDLFSGPGDYKDGTKSTPLLVLEKATEDEDIRNMLVSVFNDVNPDHAQSLQDAIDSSPVIGNLKRKPIVRSMEVGAEITQVLEHVRTIPTLFFVDPWGYKGLSLQLISSTVKNWGCDCIFFFNYNRINIDINNPYVIEHMNALFGEEQAEELRIKLQIMRPFERELSIVEAISQSLKKTAGQYVLPFCFKSVRRRRSSHHLIFVSKHIKGYEIMKRIMAEESTDSEQGVPSFEYNPWATDQQPLLFEYSRPLDDLAGMLLTDFAGRTMTMKQIFDQHNVGTSYIEKNYKDVLANLEIEGKIRAEPPASTRPKRKGKVTFADKVKVTFPPKTE